MNSPSETNKIGCKVVEMSKTCFFKGNLEDITLGEIDRAAFRVVNGASGRKKVTKTQKESTMKLY